MLMEIHQRTNHDPQDRDCPKTKENLFYEPDDCHVVFLFQVQKYKKIHTTGKIC